MLGKVDRIRRRRRAAIPVAAVALAAVLAGCADDGDGPARGAGTSAPASPSVPAPASAPATAPEPGPAAAAPAAPPASPTAPARKEPMTTNRGTAADDRALLEAARTGNTDGVRAALAAGANVEARDGSRRTPLVLAALEDKVDAARVLVEAGADPDAQDDRRDSAWLVTGVTGSVEMAKVLLPANPDLTLTNRYGGTSLIPASERGHAAYVRYVTANTAMNVNHVNNLGWTALLEAVILGDGGPDHQDIVRTLLAEGADPGIPDKDGVSALRHAEREGHAEIAAMLRAAR